MDIVLLYAVLEHCTTAECLETIRTSWDLLRPGGHLVVIETPSRFIYWDYHTAFMPFFHMLPGPLAVRYADRSPRKVIAHNIRTAREQSEESAAMAVVRLGTGISFHDFQLALEVDDLGPFVAADGYEPEMLDWFPIKLEERLLQTFFLEHNLNVPIGFARYVLNLVLRKPHGPLPDRPLISTASRAEHLINFAHMEREEKKRQARKNYIKSASRAVLRAIGLGDEPPPRPEHRFERLKSVRLRISGADAGLLTPAHDVEVNPGGDHVVLRSTGADPYLYLPRVDTFQSEAVMRIDIDVPGHTTLEVFYSTADAPGYTQERAVRVPVYRGRNTVSLELPPGAGGRLRLDPGELPGAYRLYHLEIRS